MGTRMFHPAIASNAPPMKKPDRLITILFALWFACFVLSFCMPFLLEAKGDGFTRGFNRISALIGWQFAASLLALVGFIASFGRVRGNAALAWMGRGPFFLQITLIVVVVAFFLYQGLINKPSPETSTPKTSTAPAASASAASQAITALPIPAAVETFSGIYRGGFEASHFYATDGRGPWWVDVDGELGE